MNMDLNKAGCAGLYWTQLAEDRDQCKHGNEPLGSTKGEEFIYQFLKKVSSPDSQLHMKVYICCISTLCVFSVDTAYAI